MILSRRSLLSGLVGLVAAPVVIRTPGLLMPVRTIVAKSTDLRQVDRMTLVFDGTLWRVFDADDKMIAAGPLAHSQHFDWHPFAA